jgi:hypothetical protein
MIVGRDGSYDCGSIFKDVMKSMLFPGFKPVTPESHLLARQMTDVNKTKFSEEIFNALIGEKMSSSFAKVFCESNGLDYGLYCQMAGISNEVVVTKEVNPETPVQKAGDWDAICTAALEKLTGEGFTIIAEKSSGSGELLCEYTLNDKSTLSWIILGSSKDMELTVTTPKGTEKDELFPGKDMSAYINAATVVTDPGDYSFALKGDAKGYVVVGQKIMVSDQEKARQALTGQGYEIVFDQTQQARSHYPVSKTFDFSGEFAWVAFTDATCGLIVGVNAVNTGNTEVRDGVIINTGSVVLINESNNKFTAVPVNCDAMTTFIIGVK